MIIRTAKRSKTSFCRVCGRIYLRGDKYVALSGSFRVMRANMCMEHFKVKNCDGCKNKERMKCVTDNKQCICIEGGIEDTVVREI